MSQKFAVLVIHNPGPKTKIELKGMEGEVPEEPYQNAAAALRDAMTAQVRGDQGWVLIYHEDNGQLCAMSSAKELLDEGLMTTEEVGAIDVEMSSLYVHVKVCVMGLDGDGRPDIFQCIILCKVAEVEEGKHYNAAKAVAEGLGYEPVEAFDEDDPGFRFIAWQQETQVYDLDGQPQN